MELLDVIKRPVITEKSMLAMDEKIYFRSGHSRKQNFSKTSC